MEEAEARRLAAAEIAGMQAEIDEVNRNKREHGMPEHDVELVVTAAEKVSETWCVSFNNRRFLDTGEIAHALAGNGPILVAPDGRLGRAGSAPPLERWVVDFEAEGRGHSRA